MNPQRELAKAIQFLQASPEYLDSFFAHYEEHRQLALKLYTSIPYSKGEDVLFHSRQIPVSQRKQIDAWIEELYPDIWNTYLKDYYSEEVIEYKGLLNRCVHHWKAQKEVGLLVMATGKYTQFLEPLLHSADQFFLPGHKKNYYIFTDGDIPKLGHAVKIEQKKLGWPYDTMMRFSVYYNARDYFAHCDYLFACDADMLFVNTVTDEILGERVATRHPGFVTDRHDDYERNIVSTAYVAGDEGDYYFAGGFYGGSKDEFLKICHRCNSNIMSDLMKHYIAIWHDESHLNRYFIDNKPTVILSPSYCYPESWHLPFDKKLLALDKNHSEMR